MCSTLSVRTHLHGVCVGIMCYTSVRNILRVLNRPMKDFNEGPRQDLSVATLAQAVTFRSRICQRTFKLGVINKRTAGKVAFKLDENAGQS